MVVQVGISFKMVQMNYTYNNAHGYYHRVIQLVPSTLVLTAQGGNGGKFFLLPSLSSQNHSPQVLFGMREQVRFTEVGKSCFINTYSFSA